MTAFSRPWSATCAPPWIDLIRHAPPLAAIARAADARPARDGARGPERVKTRRQAGVAALTLACAAGVVEADPMPSRRRPRPARSRSRHPKTHQGEVRTREQPQRGPPLPPGGPTPGGPAMATRCGAVADPVALGVDPRLSGRSVAAPGPELPLHPHLFRLCPGGPGPSWTAARRLAGGLADSSLPSVGRHGIRSRPRDAAGAFARGPVLPGAGAAATSGGSPGSGWTMLTVRGEHRRRWRTFVPAVRSSLSAPGAGLPTRVHGSLRPGLRPPLDRPILAFPSG